MLKTTLLKVVLTTGCILFLSLFSGCVHPSSQPQATATLSSGMDGLSENEVATLTSLERLDDYPLYAMHYVGDYSQTLLTTLPPPLPATASLITPATCPAGWGCSLFAALGDPARRLYGRNFDWRFSPALILFTDPPDGFASVSMVDIEYLGFAGDQAKHLLDLDLGERQRLLAAPALPFDGMNERGLAIGMAAVPSGGMQPDPGKETMGELAVIRQVLDHASTVDEAIEILSSVNIDMSEVPIHYLVASSSGDSALVEFYQAEMVVFRNQDPYQLATNFLVASTNGNPQGQCPRYDRINQKLQEREGRLSILEALDLLKSVSQDTPQNQSDTQWSIVYDMTAGEIKVIMGRDYTAGSHSLQLDLAGTR